MGIKISKFIMLANFWLYFEADLNFVGVDDGVANGASNVPLV